MQAEPALDIVKIQEALLGIPRSVGDFFTWGPVITDKVNNNPFHYCNDVVLH
jgi:hypothetical protein